MISVNYWVLVLFRLINFSVVISLAWYIFKRYGLSSVKQAMIEYRAYFEGLATTHRDFKQEQYAIEQRIIEDQKEQYVLKERLMRWRARMDEQIEQLTQEREDRKKKLKELTVLQQKQVMQYRILRMVMPSSLLDARHKLEEMARDHSIQSKIFDQALSIMHRNEGQ